MAPRPPPEAVLNLALALVIASNAPVLLLDSDLAIVAASPSFCDAFQVDPTSVLGCALAGLGAGEWNMPQLVELLKATASGFAEVKNYEVVLARQGLETRRLIANAKRLHYGDGGAIRVILSIADVTDAYKAKKLREDLLREKDVLLQELNHRVANSLQIIASILMQSARKVQSEETRCHLYNAHQRIISVAALQRQLAGSKRGDVELRPYLVTLCNSISASMIQDSDQLSLEVIADDSVTSADTSASVGLIVTELVINAIKHAFPDNRSGGILVDYRSNGPNWTISVSDDGVGMPQDPGEAKPGLGTSIVEALAKQLGAEIRVAKTRPGTNVSIAHACVSVLIAQAAI